MVFAHCRTVHRLSATSESGDNLPTQRLGAYARMEELCYLRCVVVAEMRAGGNSNAKDQKSEPSILLHQQ